MNWLKNIYRFLFRAFLVLRYRKNYKRVDAGKSSDSKETTVVLDLHTYGRFMPYLLTLLLENSKSLEINRDGPIYLYRSINRILKKSNARLRFVGDIPSGKNENRVIISDRTVTVPSGQGGEKRITINYDYYSSQIFNDAETAMPFYMHPNVYLTGLHARVEEFRENKKRIRLLFAGTMPGESDSIAFRFPMLNRYEVLSTIQKVYGDQIQFITGKQHFSDLSGQTDLHNKIVFAVTGDNANTLEKHVLSQEEYFKVLSQSHFFIAPPGYKIPHCHNLIEAMAVGTIPVFNYGDVFFPELEDMKTCVSFRTKDELVMKIEKILNMKEAEMNDMCARVMNFYDTYLSPAAFHSHIFNINQQAVTMYVCASSVSV